MEVTQAVSDDQLGLNLKERTTGVANGLEKFSIGNSSGSFREIAWNRNRTAPDLACQSVKLMLREAAEAR